MTARAMKGDKDDCLAAGMDGYIAKPIQMDELMAVLVSVRGNTEIDALACMTLSGSDAIPYSPCELPRRSTDPATGPQRPHFGASRCTSKIATYQKTGQGSAPKCASSAAAVAEPDR